MIEYRNATVFNSNCEAIVNTVNCVGIMGTGLALEFSLRYPNMLKQYEKDCENKIVKIGKVNLYKDENQIILNFPTKFHWKYPSKIEWIEKGLDFIVQNYKSWNIRSIALPPLGCSNGGLNFDKDVKPLIEKKLSQLDILIVVCVDPGYPEGKEKEMVGLFHLEDINALCVKLKISGKGREGLISNQHQIKRFYEISKIPGVGKKSYEKIFNYYYNINNLLKIKTYQQLKFDIY